VAYNTGNLITNNVYGENMCVRGRGTECGPWAVEDVNGTVEGKLMTYA
jgi:hypothetical protein